MVPAVALAAFPAPAAAQWKPTRHFTVRDGLVQSQVTGLAQDENGYLWIATQGGLCRFDGDFFLRLTRSEGLPDNVVNAVAAVGPTPLVATDLAGLASWNGDSFREIAGLPLPRNERLTGIRALSDGTLLVGSPMGLLARKPGENRWTRISDQPVHTLSPGVGNRTLVVSTISMVVGPDLVARTLPEITGSGNIVALSENTDHLWAATDSGKMVLVHGDDTQWFSPAVPGDVRVLLSDRQGAGVWIGTTRGLWRMGEDGGRVRPVTLRPGRASLEVSTLLEDREGSLWVGTWGAGLFQIPPSPWTLFTLETGFPSHSAWAFTEGSDGCMWMATTDHGVVSWCGDHWGPTLGLENGLPGDKTYTLAHDLEGALWIGTTTGVCRKDDDGLRCWRAGGDLRDDFVRHIIPRSDGGIWMATNLGLASWHGDQWQFWGREEGLPGEIVRSLAEGPDGRLWLALDSNGVASFDGSAFTPFRNDVGLPTQRVWTLVATEDGRLLVGTDNGLWIGNPDHSEPGTVIGLDDGLPNMSVITVARDGQGNIWTGTTHGLSMLSPEGQVLRTFTASDGMSDSEAAEGAALLDSKGRMWFGMAYGVTVVDPTKLARNPVAPVVVLENVLLNGERIPGFKPISTVEGFPSDLSIRIDPTITHVRFDYTAPSFIAPDLVRFRLALTCYTDEFGPPTTDHHVTYHLLPSGRYRFGITASNNDGVPSGKPLWVDLDVRPPWYRARWFQIIAIVAAMLFGAGLFQMRNLGQVRRQLWLEEEVSKRTEELDKANRRIQQQNALLKEMSRTDPLTGLGNRRVLEETLPIEMSLVKRELTWRRTTQKMTELFNPVMVMIDIDHFKVVNDRWGHDVGDVALQACARAILGELREGDQAIRWGGEEFVVLARGLNSDGAVQFMQRLLDRFSWCRINPADGSRIDLRASLGFTQIPLGTTDFLPGSDWQSLVEVADRLMYLAKQQGRGRCCGLVWATEGVPDFSEQEAVSRFLADPEAPPPGMKRVTLLPSTGA